MSFLIEPEDDEPLLDSLIIDDGLDHNVAPRTPETDNVYDCLNDEINEVRLSYGVAQAALKSAEAAYDAALLDLADAQESTLTKQTDVDMLAVDLEFLKGQLLYT